MTSPLAAIITSFAICFLMLPVIIRYSLKKNIVDNPGRRKVHKRITPSMGGIAIFFGFLIAGLVWIDLSNWTEVRTIFIALLMIFLVGARDDLVPTQPVTKIVVQVIAAFILIVVYDLRLKSMYGVAGIYDIPVWTSYLITIFTVVVITNSYNLIDGIDGLAGTVGSIALAALGTWFLLTNDQVYAILTFSMLGALLAFLVFNWEPSKVFMGDTGAMVVGMMLAIAVIHFIDRNYTLAAGNAYRFSGSVSPALSILVIPLADTLRVFIIRIANQQSPFKADKRHIHHNILRLGYSHASATILLGTIQLGFIGLAIAFRQANDNFVIAGLVLLAFLLSMALARISRKPPAMKEPQRRAAQQTG